MAKVKKTRVQWWWVAITIIVVIIFSLYYRSQHNLTNGTISKEEAVIKVTALPEVQDYLKRVPSGVVAINGEDGNLYMVQVYEHKNGHTASFNWYKVDKSTGEIKQEF